MWLLLRSHKEKSVHGIDQHETRTSSPDEQSHPPQPGDFVLIHGYSPIGFLARWIQRRQFNSADWQYTYWDHAALVVSTDPDIIEARGLGVVRRHLSQYKPTQFAVVPVNVTIAARRRIVENAQSALGVRYGFASILGITLSAVVGREIHPHALNEQTCSSLVVRALQQGGLLPGVEPSHVVPAELARWWHVEKPVPPASAELSAPA